MRQFLGALAVLFQAASTGAFGADAVMPVRSGETRLQAPVKSVRALRDAAVVKQAHDYSCGSAALATLLSYGIGDPTSEEWVLQTVFDTATDEQKKVLIEKGLSLLDLQRISERRGYRAQGFRLDSEQLLKLKRPAIVYIEPRGYRHFAVFKGIRGDRVYLADPSLGNVRLPLYQFLDMWADRSGKGVVFIVERPDGSWPEGYELAISASDGPALQAHTARQLFDAVAPFPPPVRP